MEQGGKTVINVSENLAFVIRKYIMRCITLFIAATLALLLCVATASAEISTMPTSLKVIDVEAFYGAKSIERVILPDGVTRIESKAFVRSGLKRINLPASLQYIAPDAFYELNDLVCTGTANTYASRYCESMDIPFVPYPEPISSIKLNTSNLTLFAGDNFQLTVDYSPVNASYKHATYASSNNFVSVDGNGVITAISQGSSVVTVTAADGSRKKATVAVTVYDQPAISFASLPTSATTATTGIDFVASITGGKSPYTAYWKLYRDGKEVNATNKYSVSATTTNWPINTLSTVGTYQAELIITDKLGQTVSAKTGAVTVYGKPAISFTKYPTSATTATTGIDLVAGITGGKGPYTAYWKMYKDGKEENATNKYSVSGNTTNWPINQFGSAGSFQAELIVTDKLGQTVSAKTGTMTVTKNNPVTTAPVISNIDTQNDSVTLMWNAVANAVSYQIKAVHTGNGWVGTYSTTDTRWSSDWFGDGTYSFTVTAVGDTTVANNSKTSAAKTVTVTANKITTGPTPTITVSGTSAKITWPAIANATWYEIELYTSAGYANLLNKGDSQAWYVQKVGGTLGSDSLHKKTTYTFTNLSPGVYMVKVAACNAGGHYKFGEVREFVIGTATNYPVKTGPTVTLTVNGSSIHAAWNAVENAVIYRAFLYTASGYPNNVVFKDLYTRNNWADFSGLPDGTYYVAIAAEGTFSDPDGSKGGWKSGAAKSVMVGTAKQTKWLHGIPNYLQSDPDWANVSIGTTGTIGSIGCTTTCIAMAESYRTGTTITPDVMASRINYSGNSVTWGNLGYSFYGQNTYSVQDVMSYAYKAINNGKPLIIGGYAYENGVKKTHWIIIVGYTDLDPNNMNASCFKINDPGSSSRTTLQQFLNYRGTIDAVCIYGSPIK